MSEFQAVGTLADFNDGQPHKVDVAGTDVLIAVINGEVFAVNDTCSHAEVSLSEGELVDCKIECFLHGASFDLKTGKAMTPPASNPIDTYEVQLSADENPQILVSTKAKEN